MFRIVLGSQILINGFNVIVFQALGYFLKHEKAMQVETIGESIFANISSVLLSFILTRSAYAYPLMIGFSSILAANYLFFSTAIILEKENLLIYSWYINRASTAVSSYMRDRFLATESSQRILFVKVLKQLLAPIICLSIASLVYHKNYIYRSLYILRAVQISTIVTVICILLFLFYLLCQLARRTTAQIHRDEIEDNRLSYRNVIIAAVGVFCIGLAPADQFIGSILPISIASSWKSIGQLSAIIIPCVSYTRQLLLYYFLTAVLYLMCILVYNNIAVSFASITLCFLWGVLMSLRAILSIRTLQIGLLGRYKMLIYYTALSSGSLFFNLVLFKYTRTLNFPLLCCNMFMLVLQLLLIRIRKKA